MSSPLRVALKRYPTTKALLDGVVADPRLAFDFQEIEPIHRAFAPMAREQAFDVSEIAIFTFLQAFNYGKPLVLLPVALAARFQHGCLIYNSRFHERLTPAMLPGLKVGVRAYTQTTGAWVRDILAGEYGVDLEAVRWITFEGAHLAEYHEPPFVTRAPKGDVLSLLMAGEIDAAILGNDLPDDPVFKPVIADAAVAAKRAFARTGLIPINHMLCVRQDLARARPDDVRAIYDLFAKSKAMAPPASADAPDLRPMGFAAVSPSLAHVVDLAFEQKMIDRRFSLDELFADARAILGRDA